MLLMIVVSLKPVVCALFATPIGSEMVAIC